MAAATPQYDAVAQDYERLIAPRYARVAEAIVDGVEIAPGDAIVDVGAGTGGLSRLLVARLGPSGRLVLVDVSPGMLDVAREQVDAANEAGATVELVTADLASLPLAAGVFQHVVAQFTPLQDSAAGLAEAARVLADDGRLTIGYWGQAYGELEMLNRVRARAGIEPAVPPDPAVVARRVADAGFAEVELGDVRFDAVYPDPDAYLAYRAGFGRAIQLDDATWAAYWAALEDEVRAMAATDGSVALDWTVTILTAGRR